MNPVTAFIGVGGNIDPERHVTDALMMLAGLVRVTGVSTFYRTCPLLGRRQDDYLNGVVCVETDLFPRELKFGVLRTIEARLGRKRTDDAYASRPIDLDVIVYGKLCSDDVDLAIPDPDIYSRPFVAVPLHELSSDLILPDTGTPVARIVEAMKGYDMRPERPFTDNLRGVVLHERRESYKAYP